MQLLYDSCYMTDYPLPDSGHNRQSSSHATPNNTLILLSVTILFSVDSSRVTRRG